MSKIPNIPNNPLVRRINNNLAAFSGLKPYRQPQIIKPASNTPSQKPILVSDIIYNIKKTCYKTLSVILRKIELTAFNKIYKVANASKGKYANIQDACSAQSRNLIGSVKIKNKKTGKLEDAYLTMRKINLNKDYSKNKYRYAFENAVNTDIQIRRLNTLEWKKTNDPIKKHQMLSQNSYVLEILNTKGIPVGAHFLDVGKEYTEGKGLLNYARGEYKGIGTILTEIKALTGAITGSKNVKTIGSWDSIPFHLKSGYKETPNAEKMAMGAHIYMPEENIDKIAEKYKNTEILNNLETMIRPNIR